MVMLVKRTRDVIETSKMLMILHVEGVPDAVSKAMPPGRER